MMAIKEGFNAIFGVNYDDFMLLDLPNLPSFNAKQMVPEGMCKSLLYMDPLMGLFDQALKKKGHIPYAEYATKIRDASMRVKEFGYIFDELATLCDVLEIKAELGIKTRKAYKEKDKAGLERLLGDYEQLKDLLKDLHGKLYRVWHNENKTNGWEIQDARLGGLIQRMGTCVMRIRSYLDGEIAILEELEEELLPVGDDTLISLNWYARLISRSLL